MNDWHYYGSPVKDEQGEVLVIQAAGTELVIVQPGKYVEQSDAEFGVGAFEQLRLTQLVEPCVKPQRTGGVELFFRARQKFPLAESSAPVAV